MDWFIFALLLSVLIWIAHDILTGSLDDVGPVDIEHEHPLAKGERLPEHD